MADHLEEAAPTPLDLGAFNEALQFVTQAHAKQLRKGTSVPYITHVVAVAEALAYYYPERHDLVLAGLLHDAVEDTDVTLDEVRERFGDRVTVLVAAVTKPEDVGVPPELLGDKSGTWRHKR